MGNSNSSISEGGSSSRKLSKPRVGNRDRGSTASPAGQMPNSKVRAAQFSNSYLVGPVPSTATRTPSVEVVSPQPGATVFHDKPLADSTLDEAEIFAYPPKSPTRPHSGERSRAERIERGGSNSRAASVSVTRESSHQGTNSTQSFARARSARTAENAASTVYGVPPPSHQPQSNGTTSTERRASLARNSSSQVEVHDAVCNMRLHSTSPQPEMEPPIRTQSETSLYAPARRRSIVLTPGIATRAEPRSTSVKKNASFRNSIGPSPTASRQNSIDSKIKRRQSLPVSAPSSSLGERSATPTGFEYQQIGGMKFGSLHITNGAPAPSPANELTEAALLGAKTLKESSGPCTSSGQISDKHTLQALRPSMPLQTHSMASSGPSDHGNSTSHRDNGLGPLEVATISPPSPELQTTSKHTAVDDDLFEEEETSPPDQTAEPTTNPTAPGSDLETSEQAKLTRPRLMSIIRKNSGHASQSSKPSRASSSANDSGYGSGASFSSSQHSRSQRLTTESSDYLTSAGQSINSSDSTPSAESSSNGPSPLRSEDTPSEGTPQLSISSKDDGSVSTPRTSTSSAPQSFIRLPSLKGKDREAKQLKKVLSTERPRSPATFLQRVASPTKSSPLSGGPSAPRITGLRRFLSGSSRKGLATSYAVHELDSAFPSIPLAVEEKLQEHNGKFPTAPQRLALRVEASRDSLGTIMSVDDSSESVSNDAPHQVPTTQAIAERKVAEDKGLGRRRSHKLSVSSVSSSFSFSDAASAVLSTKSPSRKSMVRRRMTTDGHPPSRSSSRRRANVDPDSDDEVVVDSVMVDHRDFMLPDSRRSIANRSFDQALIDQGRYPPSDNMAWLREPYVDPRAPVRHHPLRSRRSAPDVRQTAAGHLSPVLEREYSKASRTPPPISMQTRGSKKHKKRSMPKASRRQSSPGGMLPGRRMAQFDLYDSGSSNASSYEDLAHYPSAAASEGPFPRLTPAAQYGPYPDPSVVSAPKPKMKRPMFAQRYSFDGHGQRSMHGPPPRPSTNLAPMPSRQQSKEDWLPNRSRGHPGQPNQQAGGPEPRDQHGGAGVPGEAAPFRVLHSYNSPAYRGIPIWG